MGKDFSSRLAKFGKTFKTAKERAKEEGGFGNDLPDGKYKARLQSCEINEAKSSGRLQVAFNFAITAGESKGEKVGKYQSIETEDDQVWLARDLRRFGIDMPDDASDLEDVVKLLDESKPELIISLKTKDSGQFCYIDKVTSELDAGDFKTEENDDSGDDDKGDEDSDDDATEDIEEGDTVTFKEDGEKFKGKVLSIDEEEDTAIIKDEDGVKHKDIDLDDLTKVEEKAKEKEDKKEEEADIEIGMKVEFKNKKGKIITGKISKILEDENSVVVKDKEGDKHTVSVDDLSLPD
jgi:hypothetical protein